MARIPVSKNLSAFLDTIATSEGTANLGDSGYNVLVGGSLFDSYADHPRTIVDLGHGLKSTAAGRYQLLARYVDAYKAMLRLPDFSPESQDRIAVQQITESHALSAVEAGEFAVAINLCAHIWASLPGAGWHQHENTITALQDVYTAAGGSVRA